MTLFGRGWAGARRAFRLPPGPGDAGVDVDLELRFHLEGRIEELVSRGMPREQAEAEARLRFGDLDRYGKEARAIDAGVIRTRRRTETIDAVRREASHAIRALARTRSFSLIAIATLGIGIGATTAIFTLLERVVLSPLSYPESERLVYVAHDVPRVGPDARWGVSPGGFFYVQQHATSFEGFGVYTAPVYTMMIDGVAERIQGARASASLFTVLRATPAVGRMLTAEDDRPDAPLVAMLSHGFWQRRHGGDRNIVGRTIELDSRVFEVVGVMAPGIDLPDLATPVWLPRNLNPNGPFYNEHYLTGIGRLRPGVTPEAARAELERLYQRLPEALPRVYYSGFFEETGFAPYVVRLREQIVGGMARVLWILLGSVGLVLVIACANVANLFVVRIESRRREIAIRSALGAGGSQLAWHYLSEALIVSMLGGTVGLGLAYIALESLLAVAPPGLPRLADLAVGWPSVLFAGGVALCAALIFGLAPLARKALNLAALRDGGRGLSASRAQTRLRSTLVVSQVALALVLLAAAGLLLRSFANLHRVQPGFDPTGVLTMDVSLPVARYADEAAVNSFHRELIRRIEAIPGVERAGGTTMLPLRDGRGCALIFVEDRPPGERGQGCLGTARVAPGYFDAMGITVRGAAYTWAESDRRDGGVVVTKALADRIWPGEDPIGKGIRGNGEEPPFYRIVGVAVGVREGALEEPPTETVYFPMLAIPGASLWSPPRAMTIVVRTGTTRSDGVTAAIRQTLADLDPGIPLANVQTMERVVARSIARTSFTMLLLAIAAGMALLLSAVGIFGVISFIVGQRRTEIGIRIALGARPAQVSRLVVGQALRLALAGIAIGIAAALGATRVMEALLFEVSATDPLVLVSVSALLLALAGTASYAPARRSARIDPADVLRAE